MSVDTKAAAGGLPAASLPEHPSAGSADVLAGVRAMAPMVIGYLPFGLLVGAAVAASANPLAAWLSTWTIYGGAAHLATLDVLHGGAGWVGAAVVGLLVNARLSAYATSMAPAWRPASRRWRVLAAVTLSDAPWALARSHRPDERSPAHRRFYLGAALTLWLAWPSLVTLGVFVGGRVGTLPVVGLLPCLTLGTVVVSQLRHRPVLAAAGTAAAAAVATTQLPAEVALLVCGASGSVAAALTHRRQPHGGPR